MEGELTILGAFNEDDAPLQNLPMAAITSRRAAVAWWIVFCGPVAVTLALLIAGTVADRRAAVLVFTLGVWGFSLTLGLAAAPRIHQGTWWAGVLAVSFASAATAFGLLYVVSELSDNLPK
jgi:MFS family permease